MALLDWSMTMLCYPAHRRSGAEVIGLSHMSLYAALHWAEMAGLSTGWLSADEDPLLLDGAVSGERNWVTLANLFMQGNVAQTEGVVSGTVTYVPAEPSNGSAPEDRDLIAWAEEQGLPWIQMVDNEYCYLGNVDDQVLRKLFIWFLNQRPLTQDGYDDTMTDRAFAAVRQGLESFGWTRNCSLVRLQRSVSQDLWAGVHERCILDKRGYHTLSEANLGMHFFRTNGCWQVNILENDCPLDDVYARVTPPLVESH